jgi:hypothetical protein
MNALTIFESLKATAGGLVADRAIEVVCTRRGIDAGGEATQDVLGSAGYRLARADVMMIAAQSPNVKQADVAFDSLVTTREEIKAAANAVYGALGDAEFIPERKTQYGYKGSSL